MVLVGYVKYQFLSSIMNENEVHTKLHFWENCKKFNEIFEHTSFEICDHMSMMYILSQNFWDPYS